jgi:hypothetical protein
MDSNDIQCEWHNEKKRLFYIDENLKVLPCCYYVLLSDRLQDPVFRKHSLETPDWNDLSKYTLEEIAQHKIYQKHIWYPGWKGENASPVCLKNCGNKMIQQRIAKTQV